MCGLTYIGTGQKVVLKRRNKKGIGPGEVERVFYCCNGKHNGRSMYGKEYQPCLSKSVSADLEDIIWSDIAEFLRNPGDVLGELKEILNERRKQPESVKHKLESAQAMLREKQGEKDRIIALFRRGRIDETTLDRQLDDITREEEGVAKQVEMLTQEIRSAQASVNQFESLEPLLIELRHRLEEPLSWELKRQLVEALVESITVETHGEGRDRYANVVVVYCFEQPQMDNRAIFLSTDSCTDVRADIYLAE